MIFELSKTNGVPTFNVAKVENGINREKRGKVK